MKAIALILGITVLAGCGESKTDRRLNQLRAREIQVQHQAQVAKTQSQVAEAQLRKDLLAACSARSK